MKRTKKRGFSFHLRQEENKCIYNSSPLMKQYCIVYMPDKLCKKCKAIPVGSNAFLPHVTSISKGNKGTGFHITHSCYKFSTKKQKEKSNMACGN